MYQTYFGTGINCERKINKKKTNILKPRAPENFLAGGPKFKTMEPFLLDRKNKN